MVRSKAPKRLFSAPSHGGITNTWQITVEAGLCSFCVATCSAWKWMSARVHGPGTTMVGQTAPSSEVMRRGFFGVPAAQLVSPLFAGAPDDRVVGRAGPGDVDGLHQRMVAQVLAHSASHERCAGSRANQRLQGRLEELDQVVVDRVHLQHHHFVFGEQSERRPAARSRQCCPHLQDQRQSPRLVFAGSRDRKCRRWVLQIRPADTFRCIHTSTLTPLSNRWSQIEWDDPGGQLAIGQPRKGV